MNGKFKKQCDELGITAEVISLIAECDCGNIGEARLEDLSKLRKWEIMEVIGNDIDPRGEYVEDWSDIKRIATFCKAFEIELNEIPLYYATAICNEGFEIAYRVKGDIILILWGEEDNKERILRSLKGETLETADPLAVALQVSSQKNGKYHLGARDEANGFFFEYNGIRVPFKALLNENGKTEGIVGIAFGTARDCPSRKMGLCQLPNDKLCYARGGELRATRRDNENGSHGMDSLYNGLLCSAFWDEFAVNGALRVKFMDYLDSKDIETLRFNLKSDFRHETDILCIYHLAKCGYKLTGYTARDDLSEFLEPLGDLENCILNGSNRMYTNRFKATTSIREFVNATYKCRGNCSNCRNCYRLRGEVITVLVHGNGSETALNTAENRQYIAELLGVAPSKLEGEALGLVTNINKLCIVKFETTKDFLKAMGEL